MSYKIDGRGGLAEHKGGPIRCGESVLSDSLFQELAQVTGEKDKTKIEAALLKKLKITKDSRSIDIKKRSKS